MCNFANQVTGTSAVEMEKHLDEVRVTPSPHDLTPQRSQSHYRLSHDNTSQLKYLKERLEHIDDPVTDKNWVSCRAIFLCYTVLRRTLIVYATAPRWTSAGAGKPFQR